METGYATFVLPSLPHVFCAAPFYDTANNYDHDMLSTERDTTVECQVALCWNNYLTKAFQMNSDISIFKQILFVTDIG